MSTIGVIIAVFLILVLVGALPAGVYQQPWGPTTGGAVGLLLLLVLVLALTGRL